MGNQNKEFGGYWTESKIKIFLDYLYAYLQIMKKQNFKLIYFDGFAGSGRIKTKIGEIEGVSMRVLSMPHPKEFDIYYFVELDSTTAKELKNQINKNFPDKKNKTYVITDDCNKKIEDLAGYLSENKNRKALVFLDPKGMQLKFITLKKFKELSIDLWLLIPTGMGVNRMLSAKGKILKSFINKLKEFLDMSEIEIMEYFYKEKSLNTLFGEEIILTKDNTIQKSVELIVSKLKEIFKFVSEPFPMKNTKNSILYHFIFATNNKFGLKIANDIIGKRLKETKV